MPKVALLVNSMHLEVQKGIQVVLIFHPTSFIFHQHLRHMQDRAVQFHVGCVIFQTKAEVLESPTAATFILAHPNVTPSINNPRHPRP